MNKWKGGLRLHRGERCIRVVWCQQTTPCLVWPTNENKSDDPTIFVGSTDVVLV